MDCRARSRSKLCVRASSSSPLTFWCSSPSDGWRVVLSGSSSSGLLLHCSRNHAFCYFRVKGAIDALCKRQKNSSLRASVDVPLLFHVWPCGVDHQQTLCRMFRTKNVKLFLSPGALAWRGSSCRVLQRRLVDFQSPIVKMGIKSGRQAWERNQPCSRHTHKPAVVKFLPFTVRYKRAARHRVSTGRMSANSLANRCVVFEVSSASLQSSDGPARGMSGMAHERSTSMAIFPAGTTVESPLQQEDVGYGGNW